MIVTSYECIELKHSHFQYASFTNGTMRLLRSLNQKQKSCVTMGGLFVASFLTGSKKGVLCVLYTFIQS